MHGGIRGNKGEEGGNEERDWSEHDKILRGGGEGADLFHAIGPNGIP
jgi:hypothetical protein